MRTGWEGQVHLQGQFGCIFKTSLAYRVSLVVSALKKKEAKSKQQPDRPCVFVLLEFGIQIGVFCNSHNRGAC